MPDSPSPKILLVQRDADALRRIRAGLAGAGIVPVAECHTRPEVLKRVLESRPDLALVSLTAPYTEGIEIARALREQFNVPVVFVANNEEDATLRAAMLADPFGYVTPPYETRAWRTIIEISLYRHRAESRVSSFRAEQSAIIHAAHDGFWMSDVAGRLLDVNEAYCRLSGYSRAEILQMSVADLTDEAHRADVPQLLAEVVHSGAIRYERQHRRKDGAYRNVEVSASYLPTSGGRIFAFVRDVTERKQAEEAIRASERALKLQATALEAAANAIVITDQRGVIQWANTAFTRDSGYPPGEFIGRTFRELVNSGHHDEAFFARLWQTISTGDVWHGEIINRRKDDTTYVDETTITPVKAADGTITHFIAVKQDITQRRNLEEQFRQAQKMEAIGQLAGGVAHDFNNILAAVLMYLGILQDEPLIDANLRAMLKELQKEVKRGAGLTRQLLTFSRRQAIEPQPLDLDQVIDGLMKMLARLLGEHISVIVQHAPRPLPAVEADPGMMEQVIINLCVNARDAMEQGGRLILRTQVVDLPADAPGTHPEGRPGRFVRLEVEDNGCGMDEPTMRRIFEPFFTTKPAGKGTGLGLATVYGIVKQHRGWIEVQSAPGHGTTFSVYLPLAELAVAPPVEAETAPPQRGTGETILVVEDDPSVRSVMTQSLRLGGYRVLEADSGPAALRQWQKHAGELALLLTDLVMPDGMDGYALAARLRKDRPQLKVVLCTGYRQSSSGPAGANGHTLLRKPFGAPELLNAIRSALDAK